MRGAKDLTSSHVTIHRKALDTRKMLLLKRCDTIKLQRCIFCARELKEKTNVRAIHFLVAARFVTADKSQDRISLHIALHHLNVQE